MKLLSMTLLALAVLLTHALNGCVPAPLPPTPDSGDAAIDDGSAPPAPDASPIVIIVPTDAAPTPPMQDSSAPDAAPTPAPALDASASVGAVTCAIMKMVGCKEGSAATCEKSMNLAHDDPRIGIDVGCVQAAKTKPAMRLCHVACP